MKSWNTENEIEKELISVIIPVYNVRPYLEEAVESVIHQKYSNLEIILVDDGSIDGSGKMCDRFAKLDQRIIVIHQQNKGLSAARNSGLDHCKGEYIAFLDSDDAYCTNMLLKMWRVIRRVDADIVECDYAVYRNADKLDSTQAYMKRQHIWNRKRKKGMFDSFDALLLNLNGIIACNVWNKLYKREVWNQLRFREGQNYEDYDIILPLLEKAKKVYILNDVLIMHRKRRGSITTTFTYQNLKDRFSAHQHYLDFVRHHSPKYFSEADLLLAKERFCVALLSEYFRGVFRKMPNKKKYYSFLRSEIRHLQDDFNNVEFKRRIKIGFWLTNNVPIVILGVIFWVYRPFQIFFKRIGFH